MSIQKNILGVALVMSAIGGIQAQAADLAGFSANYAVKADGKSGTATRILTKNGNSYNYSVKASAAGIASVNQLASFSLSNGRVLPSSASTSIKIFGIGYTHKIKFNNSAKSVVSTYKGKSTTLNMSAQAYDDLSLEAQIRQELLNGRFSGSYLLVKKTEIETAKFKKSGTAKLTVPAGTYDVIRIDLVHEGSSRATSFWLAPSLNYLPVKVSQTNDGKVSYMELTKVN